MIRVYVTAHFVAEYLRARRAYLLKTSRPGPGLLRARFGGAR